MLPELHKIKGIHPGAILKRELKQRGVKNNEFAITLGEHKQTISAILNEKRGINAKLSIKIGEALGIDNDYFMILQVVYEVSEATKPKLFTPNLENIRKVLFWDTNFEELDWNKNRKAIIKRIFERGNDLEIKEIISFYGKDTIIKELVKVTNDFLPSFNENLLKYNIR